MMLAVKWSLSSKKQVVFIMMIFVIPLVLLLIIYNIYVVNVLNNKIEQTNRNSIMLYQNAFEKNLSNADTYMSNLVSSDTSFMKLMFKQDPIDLQFYAQDMMKKYQGYFQTNEIIGGMFVYSKPNNLFYKTYRHNYSHDVREGTESFLKAVLQTKENYRSRGWFPQEINGSYYLFRILGSRDTFTVCMIDFNDMIMPQHFSQKQGGSFFAFATQEGVPLTSIATIQDKGIAIRKHNETHYISGSPQKYFIVQNYSASAKLNYIYIMPYRGFLFNLDTVQIAFLVGSVFILLLMFISFLLLERSYFKPLKRMMATMKQIKNGHVNATMSTSSGVNEFRQMSSTFNEMMTEIKDLKIESYEKEMKKQQAELQFLQIQIKPHFYLNVLKNLFGIAEQKKYDQIQEMILLLSRHLRYMFQENSSLVPLADEIVSVENYMQLQQMSASRKLICKTNVDGRLKDFRIPPISILTFVENAIKHAVSIHGPLIISIKAALLETNEDKFVNITVMDNGAGFSDEMLVLLNDPNPSSSKDHVGILNVIRRCNVIYQNKCTFLFSTSGGACIDIFIPYHSDEEKGRVSR
ncbi:sensor histidine kinase [Paenibacillus lignilyticus]|uniref:Histidine kinase n=1 Tax=Paenibacillus lignilyticus TaxID=1172615 RepID=A0ABS5C6I5_9BACL|nr:histidine kinase [Paenibacillus lignilyticus]MBP3961601.1 histidine kinase [Paenibacillus lignilyticus]MBP3963729.1 histidine kinase [Paenibacillus lignilyticus]